MHIPLYSVQVHPHCVSLSFPPPDSPLLPLFLFIFMHLSLQMREKCDIVFFPTALLSFLPLPLSSTSMSCTNVTLWERACSACLLSLVDFEQEGLQVYPFSCESSVFLSVGARRCLLLFTVLFLCMPTCLFLSVCCFWSYFKGKFFHLMTNGSHSGYSGPACYVSKLFLLEIQVSFCISEVMFYFFVVWWTLIHQQYQIWWFASFRML